MEGNKMINTLFHTTGTVPRSNIKIIERGTIDIPNILLHHHSLSWLVDIPNILLHHH